MSTKGSCPEILGTKSSQKEGSAGGIEQVRGCWQSPKKESCPDCSSRKHPSNLPAPPHTSLKSASPIPHLQPHLCWPEPPETPGRMRKTPRSCCWGCHEALWFLACQRGSCKLRDLCPIPKPPIPKLWQVPGWRKTLLIPSLQQDRSCGILMM